MPSKLEICNQSILAVGESPITQLELDNQSTKSAKAVGLQYESAKKSFLSMHPWKPARKTKTYQKSDSVGSDLPGYDSKVDAPPDSIRIWLVANDWGSRVPYSLNGTDIHVDEYPVSVRYISNIPAEEISAVMEEPLYLYLAYRIVTFITTDTNFLRIMNRRFQDSLRLARSVDAKEDNNDSFFATDWLEERLSSSRSGHLSPGIKYPHLN